MAKGDVEIHPQGDSWAVKVEGEDSPRSTPAHLVRLPCQTSTREPQSGTVAMTTALNTDQSEAAVLVEELRELV